MRRSTSSPYRRGGGDGCDCVQQAGSEIAGGGERPLEFRIGVLPVDLSEAVADGREVVLEIVALNELGTGVVQAGQQLFVPIPK